MMKKVHIGIIGTGGISHAHMVGYKAQNNVEVIAACDVNKDRVNDFAKKYNINNTFDSYKEMLKMSEIDAVSVCTRNDFHAAATIEALKAGKHVLCEKPMAMNLEQALEMQKVASESGKLLMIGFVRRYANETTVIKEFIDKGYLGDIYYAKVLYLRRCGNPGGWFSDIKRSGGGPLIDLGVHVIDLIRYLIGGPNPVSVYGVTFANIGSRANIKGFDRYKASNYSGYSDVEDFASAMIRFDNGAVLAVETSFSLNLKEDKSEIELFGTKGGARMDPTLQIYTEIEDYMVDITPKLTKDSHWSDTIFSNEIAHFVDCVENGTICKSPSDEGVQLMKIIDAIYKSAATNREVILD